MANLRDVFYKILLPGNRSRFAIVAGKKLEVKHVDCAVIVQISGGGSCGVVAHANGQCVELINNAVPIDVTSGQSNGGHCASSSVRQRDGTLRAEESTGGGCDRISSSGNRQDESTICVGIQRRGE